MPLALPAASSLAPEVDQYDYRDYRRLPLSTQPDAARLLQAFTTAAPPWVGLLIRWRNRLVAPFGLKTGIAPEPAQAARPFAVGQRLGLFRLLHLGPYEAVLGEDDRHLDFRVVLLAHDGGLWCCTLVRTRNAFGRSYLALIKPWHNLIAGSMLRRMARQLAASPTHAKE